MCQSHLGSVPACACVCVSERAKEGDRQRSKRDELVDSDPAEGERNLSAGGRRGCASRLGECAQVLSWLSAPVCVCACACVRVCMWVYVPVCVQIRFTRFTRNARQSVSAHRTHLCVYVYVLRGGVGCMCDMCDICDTVLSPHLYIHLYHIYMYMYVYIYMHVNLLCKVFCKVSCKVVCMAYAGGVWW
jgi:hypothetical protein